MGSQMREAIKTTGAVVGSLLVVMLLLAAGFSAGFTHGYDLGEADGRISIMHERLLATQCALVTKLAPLAAAHGVELTC